ncbi:MAG: VWA domain-containing protein, partial [Deltaproteobacteria bacterium]|nr:VWA domain-containing protein [Deltaproteobacteria bacterium]
MRRSLLEGMLALGMAVAAAIGGCSCPPVHSDPCSSVTCAEPTSCEVVDGAPRCVLHRTIAVDRAADILFVIDNSGSMREEQLNLA